MKKLSAVVLLAALVAAPAFADDTPAGVASDVNAVQKDNGVVAKDNAELAKDRAAKAQDKANGNWGSQAVDSAKIGVDKTKKSEKSTEKDVDTKTLNSDVNSATNK